MGFIIRGFIWDIPILIFAYVLFGGPKVSVVGDDDGDRRTLMSYGMEGSEFAAMRLLEVMKRVQDLRVTKWQSI